MGTTVKAAATFGASLANALEAQSSAKRRKASTQHERASLAEDKAENVRRARHQDSILDLTRKELDVTVAAAKEAKRFQQDMRLSDAEERLAANLFRAKMEERAIASATAGQKQSAKTSLRATVQDIKQTALTLDPSDPSLLRLKSTLESLGSDPRWADDLEAQTIVQSGIAVVADPQRWKQIQEKIAIQSAVIPMLNAMRNEFGEFDADQRDALVKAVELLEAVGRPEKEPSMLEKLVETLTGQGVSAASNIFNKSLSALKSTAAGTKKGAEKGAKDAKQKAKATESSAKTSRMLQDVMKMTQDPFGKQFVQGL